MPAVMSYEDFRGADHIEPMKDEVRAKVEAALHPELYRDAHAVSLLLGESLRGTERKLRQLLLAGGAERKKEKVQGGGFRYVWRRFNEDAPLYDPVPGFDARALDTCLGGYTFKRS